MILFAFFRKVFKKPGQKLQERPIIPCPICGRMDTCAFLTDDNLYHVLCPSAHEVVMGEDLAKKLRKN